MELITKENHKIIYDRVIGKNNDTIVFLGGLMSDRKGSKASYLKDWAESENHHYICFDYLGHGESDLKFEECNINIWLENSLQIINELTQGKVILVGSSLGGWLGLRICEIIPQRIKAFIGIAAAPDFTEDLMWDIFDDAIKEKLAQKEIYNLPSDYCEGNYPITINLIKSGRDNFILRREGEVKIDLPVRLFQGMQDKDVPYKYALKIMKKLTSKDIELKIIKDADHSLSRNQDLEKIIKEIKSFI